MGLRHQHLVVALLHRRQHAPHTARHPALDAGNSLPRVCGHRCSHMSSWSRQPPRDCKRFHSEPGRPRVSPTARRRQATRRHTTAPTGTPLRRDHLRAAATATPAAPTRNHGPNAPDADDLSTPQLVEIAVADAPELDRRTADVEEAPVQPRQPPPRNGAEPLPQRLTVSPTTTYTAPRGAS
mmetsp:Transcript_2117/g.6893  ORF Transcript_2117/g.6893 Transcript_2117/m.6893 type:complete len:182 (-) Transcript_2117:26-571(-)